MIFCSVAWHRWITKHLGWIALVGMVSLGSGCAEQSDDNLYTVSGTVTYAGDPVPSGLVKFEPDTENGGTGPGDYAPIKDGTFHTTEGVYAGPMIVTICGMDGIPKEVQKDGQTVTEESLIFEEYVTAANVEAEDTVIDFTVPES